jgi:hypothetical protein
MHNEELRNLYIHQISSYYSYHIKDYEMGMACSTHGNYENAYKILVGMPEGLWKT